MEDQSGIESLRPAREFPRVWPRSAPVVCCCPSGKIPGQSERRTRRVRRVPVEYSWAAVAGRCKFFYEGAGNNFAGNRTGDVSFDTLRHRIISMRSSAQNWYGPCKNKSGPSKPPG